MNLCGIELVQIPTGKFQLGATENDRYANRHEHPRRTLEVPAFYLAKYPITEAQLGVVESSLPAVNVSWDDAMLFCESLTEKTGHTVTLPTEQQWEYACRAGSDSPFPNANFMEPKDANFLYDDLGNRIGMGQRTAVGSYPENAFGVADMVGNVAEWTRSEWKNDYSDSSSFFQDQKVIRGAGWDGLPRLLRCSNRDFAHKSTSRDNLGFRISVTINS
ncbi:formylglycine-generating enzyme family protein [Akkermansiaceae bacterium]|nr:formylglycine-generating enzyme family protein [Akkermansiaceae bacterium]